MPKPPLTPDTGAAESRKPLRLRRSRLVDLEAERVVKWMPKHAPHRGETVLVGGVRHRVVRAKVQWDGYHWRLLKLRVRPL